MTSIADAQKACDRARTDLSEVKRRQANERHMMTRRHEDEARPLQQALAEAEARLKQAQSEVAAHPDEGRRVFRDEEIYQNRWSRKPCGTKRITGVVEVWRVGALCQRGFHPNIGRPVVRLHKADGTLGVRCEYFDPHPMYGYESKWKFEDGQPSNVPKPEEPDL